MQFGSFDLYNIIIYKEEKKIKLNSTDLLYGLKFCYAEKSLAFRSEFGFSYFVSLPDKQGDL